MGIDQDGEIVGSEGLGWVESGVQFCHVKIKIPLRHQKAMGTQIW